MSNFTYIGTELELFSHATVWKSYFRDRLAPYLGAEVLEVGAGLGGTARLLCRGGGGHRRWVCLEPDPALARQVEQAIRDGVLPPCCETALGTTLTFESSRPFDTVIYIDVLEHIEDDRGELARAADRLAPGGHVIVLSPAHNWLYAPFDKFIGHYRRYSRRTLKAAAPDTLKLVRMDYLDAVGLLASLANRLMLRQSMPTARQIAVWDKGMVPLSRLLDPLVRFHLGKSVLGVWQRG